MRLQKKQREALTAWIAEGVQSDEINKRAVVFKPPFSVKRTLVDYYRNKHKIPMSEIIAADQMSALTTGLALKENRVAKLQILADKMEADILKDRLWVQDVKSIGNGENFQAIDFEYFNKAEVDAYRGVLDDIAAETGGRSKSVALTGADGKDLIPLSDTNAIAERVASLLEKAQKRMNDSNNV